MNDDETPSQVHGTACSYAELSAAESLSAGLPETRSTPVWRPVWLRSGRDLLAGAIAAATTALGLYAIARPVPAGIALAALLLLWSLETGGLPSPLALLCPLRATQDVIARDPLGIADAPTTLLAVRCDLHRAVPKPVAAIAGRATELTWLVIALTLGATAGRAVDWPETAMSAVQLIPALASLALIAVIVVSRTSAIENPGPDWTGFAQACEAAARLDARETASRRFDLIIVGATGAGGVERALRAEGRTAQACRCWEFESGDAVIEALGAID